MNIKTAMLVCLAALTAQAAMAQQIKIPISHSVALPAVMVKSSKQVSLTGTIVVRNFGGPQVILQTNDLQTNDQFAIVYSSPDTYDPLAKQFKDLEAEKTKVRIEGTLLTTCGTEMLKIMRDRQDRLDISSCYGFDSNKSITVKPL